MQPIFDSHHIEQAHEFVADKAGVETKENRQKRASSDAVEKSRLGKEHEHQDPKSGHRELSACKQDCAVGHDGVHDGIRFDHSAFNELQRKECIGTGQQHSSRSKEKQPRMVPVQKYHIFIDQAAVHMATRAKEPEENRLPTEFAALGLITLVI